MTEMIERLARAMATRRAQDPDQRVYPDACTPQGETVAAWELYAGDARALLAEMREPTRHMAEVGSFKVNDAQTTIGAVHEARDVWQAMIDAALGEAEK